LPDRCLCTSATAVVSTGDGAYCAELKCLSCGRHRGWLSEPTVRWIESVAAKFGAPEAISIHSSAIAKACAKQDEYLKRKCDPTGKSWFEIISETFDEIAPAPSGTGQGNDNSISAEN
jgi:hypothetical protein